MAGIDVAMKHPISDFPQDWSEWLGVPHGTPVRVVDSDVSTVATVADRVIEVLGPSPFVLHIEPQSYYDKFLDVRMYESNGRLTKRLQKFVHTTVLLLTKSAWGKANKGHYRNQSPLGGCQVNFCYSVVKVWELPVEKILSSGVGVLPLAPLSNASRKDLPGIIQQMSARFDAEVTRPIEAELWTATFTLLGLRYGPEFALNLLRGVRDIMRESTTYQALINEGKNEGRVEGRAEGRVEGRVESRTEDVLRLGTRRLGKPPQKTRALILSIRDESRLNELFDRAIDASSWNEIVNGN